MFTLFQLKEKRKFALFNDKDNLLKVEIAPKIIKARNPAFDATPSKLVTGLITEKGF